MLSRAAALWAALGLFPGGAVACPTTPGVDGELSDLAAMVTTYLQTKGAMGAARDRALDRLAQRRACELALVGVAGPEGPNGQDPAARLAAAGVQPCAPQQWIGIGPGSGGDAMVAWLGGDGAPIAPTTAPLQLGVGAGPGGRNPGLGGPDQRHLRGRGLSLLQDRRL